MDFGPQFSEKSSSRAVSEARSVLAVFRGPEGPVFHVHAAHSSASQCGLLFDKSMRPSHADDHYLGGFDQGGDGLTLFQLHFTHGAGRDQGSYQLSSHR